MRQYYSCIYITILLDSFIRLNEINIVQRLCKTRENSNFLKKGKMVILVKILNFTKSRMMKRTSSLESSCEI